jgi:hypothetical protein
MIKIGWRKDRVLESIEEGAVTEFEHLNYLNYVLRNQLVPRSKHSVSVIQTTQSVLYWEIIAVCSEIHTKHISTLWGQNVEFLVLNLAVRIVTTGL